MPPVSRRWSRWLHWIFETSLLIKGLLAAGEGFGGLGLLLAPNTAIATLVDWMTRVELVQDPTDRVALWLQHTAATFSIETQHFYALYLCLHGGIKLTMVLGLARRVLWAYPAAMVILAGFVAYQMHRVTLSPSPMLLALSGFDTLMIVLVWREYRLMRAARVAKG